VLAARRIPDAGLALLRRQGMAAWIWGSTASSNLTLLIPAAPRPPIESATTRNQLTLILASLVVTLNAEPIHA
jgi:O-antigen/teichoic acid export membrane protein